MNNRLKQFLAAENISQSEFADTIRVVRASVSHVLSGRNKPSYDFIRAIMAAYPDLNIDWLILGKGKMYRSSQDQNEEQAEKAYSDTQEDNLPLLFDYEEDNAPIDAHVKGNIAATSTINTISNTTQTFVKQKVATKVVIFFDDGTFQEL